MLINYPKRIYHINYLQKQFDYGYYLCQFSQIKMLIKYVIKRIGTIKGVSNCSKWDAWFNY